MIHEENQDKLHKNETEGPMQIIDVSVPSEFFVFVDKLRKFDKESHVLNLILEVAPPNIRSMFTDLTNEESTEYHFRGFHKNRELAQDAKEPEAAYQTAQFAQDHIFDTGHELVVDEGVAQLYTTALPKRAAKFAAPQNDKQVGYLVVYHNHDKFFDGGKYLAWASKTPLERESIMRGHVSPW